MRTLPLFLALTWAPLALAEGQLTKPPTLLTQVEPVTPPGQCHGTVVMQVDVDATGHVLEARIAQSLARECDAAAIAALRQFSFTPAEIDGQPAAVRLQYALEFADLSVPDAGAPTPVVKLRGTVRVAGTREPLAGAMVTVGEQTVVTDDHGAFELMDLTGAVSVHVTSPAFTPFDAQETLPADELTVVTYFLTPTGTVQSETVVRGERTRREVSQVKLTRGELRSVAGTQGDAFKVLQSLPGVSRSAFGSGNFVVRGSKAWDSRIEVDGIQIPQLFHFAGLQATFNSAVIDSLGFQAGNFGVESGRGLGGLVQAEVRTPSKSGTHGYVDVSTFDVSALVETPLSEQWSVSGSARRGLADVTLPWALKTFAPSVASVAGFSLAPQYFDYQLRAERRRSPTAKDRVFIALYGSSDRYAFITPNPFLDTDSEGNQGTAGSVTTYNRLVLGVDQRLGEHATFVSRNSVGFDTIEQLGGATNVFYRDQLVPIQARETLRIELPDAKLVVTTGLDLKVVPLTLDAQVPPPFKANLIPDPYVNRRLLTEKTTTVFVEPALFAEGAWQPLTSLSVVAGVRADYESVMHAAWVDPRVTVRFTPIEALTVKAAAGLYHQPPDYTQGLLSPTFGNPALKPEEARHYLVGAEGRLTDADSVDVQLYYKDLRSQTRQVLVSGLGSDVNIPGAATRFSSSGYGRAYGADILLRHKLTQNLFGWVAYSLSRYERDYYGGVAFAPGPLDQPHNLIVVASYTLPWNINVGAKFRWSSGPLVTPIVASLYDSSGNYYYPLPGLPWSQRLPDFLQLDVRIDKRFVFQAWSLVVFLDVQNVTNRQNPEGLFYNSNYTQSAYVTGIPILPALGARGEW